MDQDRITLIFKARCAEHNAPSLSIERPEAVELHEVIRATGQASPDIDYPRLGDECRQLKDQLGNH